MRRQTPDLILCKLQPQIVCFHHVTHAFRVNPRSTPSVTWMSKYFVQERCDIGRVIDCNQTWIDNYVVRNKTHKRATVFLNGWVFVYELRGCRPVEIIKTTKCSNVKYLLNPINHSISSPFLLGRGTTFSPKFWKGGIRKKWVPRKYPWQELIKLMSSCHGYLPGVLPIFLVKYADLSLF